jgi:SulP family sulfate permease
MTEQNALCKNRLEVVRDLFQKQYLKNDFVAGLTTSIVGISSSMAYAAIAGVNPIYGLFAAVVPAIIGGLLGSSNYLVTGPTNATALVTASILIGLNVAPDRYLELVFLLAILSGIFRLILGLLKAGTILRFVSNSVLTGFISGVGVLIILGQLGTIFGIPTPKNDGVIMIVQALLGRLSETNLYILSVSVFTILLIMIFRKINNKIPSAFLAIILISIAVEFLDLHSFGVRQVLDLGLPENVFLRFHIPSFSLGDIGQLLPGAVAMAIFTLVEGISTAKSFAVIANEEIDSSREFVSQGIASIVGGFFQAIPSSGSPSRTAVNYSSGAKTRRASMFSGIFLYIILLIFSGLIGYIALPSLAATVAFSGFSLINIEHIAMTWKTRLSTRLVLIGSFLATIFLPLHYSIYIGVGLSVLLIVLENNQAHLSMLSLMDDGCVVEKHYQINDDTVYHDIEIVNVNGDLVFGVIEHFEENIRYILHQDIQVLVIRLRWVHVLGSTGIIALIGLIKQAKKENVKVIFVGVEPEVKIVLDQSGITDMLGEESIINATPVVYESLREGVKIAENEIISHQQELGNESGSSIST